MAKPLSLLEGLVACGIVLATVSAAEAADKVLAPGQSTTFRAEMPRPPQNTQRVAVRLRPAGGNTAASRTN